MKAINKLKKHLPQFEWVQENSTSSIFGSLIAPQVQKRIGGDLYKLSNVHIFISSKMGGTELSGKPFRYAMCYQSGQVRPYRCKNWGEVEFNKLFVSDKNLDSIVNQLIKKVDLTRYYLSK